MGTVLAAAAFAVVLALAALRVVNCRERRRPLRCCPLCAGDAVVALQRDEVDERLLAVRLCCGECGTWRRVVTGPEAARGLELALDRQRRAMRDLADRLDRDVAAGDASAFVLALRSEITGADDFLARTQAFSPPPAGA
jgi:hypothetical protein